MFQLTPHQIDFMDTFGFLHFAGLLKDQHGYTKREVFGASDGALLATATPERLRHLQQLREHIPDVA